MIKFQKMGTASNKNLLNDLKYGDVSRIAKAFGVSRTTVYNTVNGTFDNEPILKKIEEIAKIRREQQENNLKELSKSMAHENH